MSEKSHSLSELKSHDKQIEELKKKIKTGEIPEEFLREHSYLGLLLEISRAINTPRDFQQLLELIVDSAARLTKAERGFLMLFNQDGKLEFRVVRNIDRKALEEEKIELSRTVVNHVLLTERSLFLGDIYKEKKFKISNSIAALGLRMVMCVPLRAKNHLLGLIYVDSHSETVSFTKLEERIFEAFASQASIAIENSHLYDSSVHDALTGLYDYGYLRARLEEEITRAPRYKKESISFIILDLDDFKTLNDSYGHLFGNSILMRVAELIKETVGRHDIAARYGGDEFAVLMLGVDKQEAVNFAQRLQKEISGLKFFIAKENVSITASIGISTFPVEKNIDSENVIVEANHALFIAKSKGKNQIEVLGLRKKKYEDEPGIIGKSKAIGEVREAIARLAKTDATILITGETGTGKEIITRLIHKKSKRLGKPFVVVNCGAIPENLLESELFGYEKGAFTGAYKQRKGKFETAQGGTIFLDEIGDLPMHLQVKILRAIEQKELDRIGGKSSMKLDVRVIAATNKNLEDEVKHGNFRRDLFYRLNVASIIVPPLRERLEDIEAFSIYYLDQMNKRYHKRFLAFTKGAMKALLQHPWPGNVRELIHRIERAVIMGTGYYIDENILGLMQAKPQRVIKSLKESRDEVDKEIIQQALVKNHWNITHVSKELRVTRNTLKRLIKRHNIKRVG